MSEGTVRSGPYSADVRMQLYVCGRILRIGQLGPDFIVLDEAIDLPPCQAEISLSIDGRVDQWTIHLPHGLAAGRGIPQKKWTQG